MSNIIINGVHLSEIMMYIFIAGSFLIGAGKLYAMFVKPLIDKKNGTLVEIAKTKDFKCLYNKKSKKLSIKFKDGYSNNSRTAFDKMVQEFHKCDKEI